MAFLMRIEVEPGLWYPLNQVPRKEALTGRRRFRSSWKGTYLVLEVEISVFDYSKRRWFCEWRNATPADVGEKELV